MKNLSQYFTLHKCNQPNFKQIMKWKNHSVVDILSHSFNQKELQLKQLKLKQLPLQIQFGALIHENQIRYVRFLVKDETVIPSQRDGCRPISAAFGNDEFSSRINDAGGKIVTKLMHSFPFKALKPFQTQYKKKPSRNLPKHYCQKFHFWMLQLSLILMILLKKKDKKR